MVAPPPWSPPGDLTTPSQLIGMVFFNTAMTTFSRSPVSNPLGKCTEEIKTSGPLELKEALTMMAYLEGITLAEYVRDILMKHCFGHVHVVRLHHAESKTTARTRREEGE